jgi:CheY-like chemotaxis protein
MADILILHSDMEEAESISVLAKERGMRARIVSEAGAAIDWLRLREFDMLLTHSSQSLSTQLKIASALWEKNLAAHFVLFNFDVHFSIREEEARLAGAEVAFGSNASSKISRLLDEIKPRGAFRRDDFAVLVVEDLDSPRDIICFYIESLGFPKVTGVASVKDALAMLEDNSRAYSCIITDLKMPQQGGIDLIRQVRQHQAFNHLPIIVLTAYGTFDSLYQSLKEGASGFLVKPPKKNDLLRELARAVRMIRSCASPRLVEPDKAEDIREILLQKGFVS